MPRKLSLAFLPASCLGLAPSLPAHVRESAANAGIKAQLAEMEAELSPGKDDP